MPTVNLNASKEDMELIQKIVERAQKESKAKLDPLHLSMDITATHCNGTPLDLEELLSFRTFDFFHDLAGISTYLDRSTGKLKDHFLPRCAK